MFLGNFKLYNVILDVWFMYDIYGFIIIEMRVIIIFYYYPHIYNPNTIIKNNYIIIPSIIKEGDGREIVYSLHGINYWNIVVHL